MYGCVLCVLTCYFSFEVMRFVLQLRLTLVPISGVPVARPFSTLPSLPLYISKLVNIKNEMTRLLFLFKLLFLFMRTVIVTLAARLYCDWGLGWALAPEEFLCSVCRTFLSPPFWTHHAEEEGEDNYAFFLFPTQMSCCARFKLDWIMKILSSGGRYFSFEPHSC